MKNFELLLLFFTPVICFSQTNIDGLVKAECSFAAYVVSGGTKPAFLQFADSNIRTI